MLVVRTRQLTTEDFHLIGRAALSAAPTAGLVTQRARRSTLRPRVAVPCEEGDASGLGVFSGTVGVHHGGLQRTGPVAWFTAPRVGFRAPLHS